MRSAPLVLLVVAGCAWLDPARPDPNRPGGADSAQAAAEQFLAAAAGADLDGLRHVVPDAAACKELGDLPDCDAIQARLATLLPMFELIAGPYAHAVLHRSSQPSPIAGSELWLAEMQPRAPLVILVFGASGKYYALARMGGS